jgi:hypothetical protein
VEFKQEVLVGGTEYLAGKVEQNHPRLVVECIYIGKYIQREIG